jgi:hypothetical protein
MACVVAALDAVCHQVHNGRALGGQRGSRPHRLRRVRYYFGRPTAYTADFRDYPHSRYHSLPYFSRLQEWHLVLDGLPACRAMARQAAGHPPAATSLAEVCTREFPLFILFL